MSDPHVRFGVADGGGDPASDPSGLVPNFPIASSFPSEPFIISALAHLEYLSDLLHDDTARRKLVFQDHSVLPHS